MSRSLNPIWLALAGLLVGCEKSTPPPIQAAVDFKTEVKPMLESACLPCHNTQQFLANLNLETKASAFRENERGRVIVPGQPTDSLLYQVLVRPAPDKKAMPAVGHRLTDDKVQRIKLWIQQGAAWPDGEAGRLKAPATDPASSPTAAPDAKAS